jgi:hypothetical protein
MGAPSVCLTVWVLCADVGAWGRFGLRDRQARHVPQDLQRVHSADRSGAVTAVDIALDRRSACTDVVAWIALGHGQTRCTVGLERVHSTDRVVPRCSPHHPERWERRARRGLRGRTARRRRAARRRAGRRRRCWCRCRCRCWCRRRCRRGQASASGRPSVTASASALASGAAVGTGVGVAVPAGKSVASPGQVRAVISRCY